MPAQLKHLIRRVRSGLLAAVTLLIPVAAPAAAEPALWVVKDDDSTVYLFGTVHLLKPDMNWRSDKIATALKDSDDLWLELEGGREAVSQALLWKFGKDPAHPLSTKLSSEEQQRLHEAAKRAGVPPVSLESLRPWLAAVVLGTAPMEQAGYQTRLGVDNQLRDEARAAQKPVRGLETVEQQFEFLAGLPPETEIAMLNQTIEAQMEGPDHLDKMAGAWLAGDVDKFAGLVVAENQTVKDEAIYKRLLTDRNKHWAAQIATMMKVPGTHFIAVGAAHLAGKNSVQDELQKRGLTVARY